MERANDRVALARARKAFAETAKEADILIERRLSGGSEGAATPSLHFLDGFSVAGAGPRPRTLSLASAERRTE